MSTADSFETIIGQGFTEKERDVLRGESELLDRYSLTPFPVTKQSLLEWADSVLDATHRPNECVQLTPGLLAALYNRLLEPFCTNLRPEIALDRPLSYFRQGIEREAVVFPEGCVRIVGRWTGIHFGPWLNTPEGALIGSDPCHDLDVFRQDSGMFVVMENACVEYSTQQAFLHNVHVPLGHCLGEINGVNRNHT